MRKKSEERVMGWMFDNVGRLIARLQKPANHWEPFTQADSTALRDTLRPGDVLLVEGKGHISGSQISHSIDLVAFGVVRGADGGRRNQRRAPRPDRSQYRRRCRVGAAVEISALSDSHLPAGGPKRSGLRKGLPIRLRTHWSRLRFQEHHRPDALSIPMAGDAALAPPNDRARLRRCQPHHLFFADRASIRRRALPDPAQDHARREPDGAARNRRDPSLITLCPARLRYFALLHGGEAHARARLQL